MLTLRVVSNQEKWKTVLLLTRGVFLVFLQDSDPLVQAVVGHHSASVPPGAVVVLHPPALPLLRGQARLAFLRRRTRPGEAEGRRSGGGQEDEQQSVHVCSGGWSVGSAAGIWRRGASCC